MYNNGRDLGGRLQVIFDRFLVIQDNEKIYLTESQVNPKTVQRKFMSDITMRIGIHVIIRGFSIEL